MEIHEMREVLTSAGVPGRIFTILELMPVAEEEIDRAKDRWPLQGLVLEDAFRILNPRHFLHSEGKTHELYRAHCTEILERVANGEDTRPGTKAEVLAITIDTSFHCPFNQTGQMVYVTLFSDLFPDSIPEDIDRYGAGGHESWEGQFEEELATLRRKARDDQRRM